MRTATLSLLALLALAAFAGCGGGDDRTATTPAAFPQEGAMYQEGGSMAPFYGEMFHDNRFYVFGTKAEFATFKMKKELNPAASKMFIGKGPDKKTVIAETSKDSPGMGDRLLKQLRARYNVQSVQ